MDDVYGGTFRLFERVRRRTAGLDFSFVDLTDTAAFEAAIRPETKMVWVETPTNPMLKIVDLQAVSAVAKQHGLLMVVDNTFASPILQRPLEHGADIVMHSATKYLNGHSDMVGGMAVVGDDAGLAEQMAFLQNSVGAVQGPFDSFLALRGVNGVDPATRDLGLGGVLSPPDGQHDGKFKVPGLRNIAVTGPYMHNGVFRELRTVIEFYDQYNNPERELNP